MREAYDIVYRGGMGEITEKKSRFIAHVFPAETENGALEHIEKIRKQYWDARHNCYAYVLGDRQQLQRFSDDGEPGGTAGKPILEVLLGKGVHNCLVVVTRYFGGTLLGTGGLVRAYSAAAQAGLADSAVVKKCPGIRLRLETDYNYVGKIQYLCAQRQVHILDSVYGAGVEMELVVPEAETAGFLSAVTEATGGTARMETGEEVWYALTEGQVQLLE